MVLFVGQILLLAPLFDSWNDRSKAIEAATPGLARFKAELFVRRLGEIFLKSIHALAWLSGLFVLPWLFVIVHVGSWVMLSAVTALMLGQCLKCNWASWNLEALKKRTQSRHS
jgi:hypothetical protein